MERSEFAQLRVLLLSGKSHGAQTLRSVLSIAGVTKIIGVDNSRRAIELLTMENYDAIFCDESSEAIDGLTFPLAVRRKAGTINTMAPVFVFHERARRSSVEKARDTGATDYITCPISPKTVMTKLEAALNNPRPFIKAPEFFGPDRRATARPAWNGEDRRFRTPKKIKVQKPAASADTTLI